MSIQSDDEYRGLCVAGAVAKRILDALIAQVAVGVTTAELDAIARQLIRDSQAVSAPIKEYGFPTATIISVNDEVVHGIPSGRVIQRGDLVSVDVTIEKGGFVADTARSVVVEPASVTAAALVSWAEEAFWSAIRMVKAGVRVRELGRVVSRVVRRRGFLVVTELSGHGVGRRIHEEPHIPNFDDGSRYRLNEGMVITLEPIVSAGSGQVREDRDGWTIRTTDGALASHYEHTLVVRRDGAELLTANGRHRPGWM